MPLSPVQMIAPCTFTSVTSAVPGSVAGPLRRYGAVCPRGSPAAAVSPSGRMGYYQHTATVLGQCGARARVRIEPVVKKQQLPSYHGTTWISDNDCVARVVEQQKELQRQRSPRRFFYLQPAARYHSKQ